MRRVLILLLLLGGMHLVLPLGVEAGGGRTLLTFGFLILAAYTVGEMIGAAGLPRIVGYLAAGVLFGPAALDVVTAAGVERLTPVSDLAIALIAFLAGAELRWGEVRDRGLVLVVVTCVEVALVFAVMATLLYGLHDLVPFLRAAPERAVVAAAVLFGAVAAVHSPAVTVALLSETRAEGPVARTTLGIVLLADVFVVLLFTASLALARALEPAVEGASPSLGAVVWEIAGALAVGALIGGAVSACLRFVGRELVLFMVMVAFFGIEVARLARVELLLTLLTAGFVTQNVSSRGGRGDDVLKHALDRSAAPVFVVFFALSGARIDLATTVPLLPLVLPLAAARAATLWAGVRIGGRLAGADPGVTRHAWMGLVSQAGVAIGLAGILADAYGEVGRSLRGLLLALIAINETMGPVLFRRALERSGEAPVAPPAHPPPQKLVS